MPPPPPPPPPPPTVIGVVAYAFGATGIATAAGVTAATIVTSTIVAAIQVGVVVGSLAYQKAQQKKAKAAAERLRKEQAAKAAALQKQLSKLAKLGDIESGSFATAAPSRDLTTMVRKSTVSRRIVYGRARLGGIWFYPETQGASNEVLYLVLGLCEGPVEAIEAVYFDGEEVTIDGSGFGTGKWTGAVIIRKYLGTNDQPPDGLSGMSSKWTTQHRLKGIAYLVVTLSVNLELFSSIPEISATVRGKNNILDPRTGLRGYSTNPALCLADYLTTTAVGPGISSADIDQASLIDAANVCDEPVTTLSGPEPRYSCQGTLDVASTVEDNAAIIIQAMNGDLIQSGGKFTIQAGQFITPTFTIDMDMLVGPIEFSSLQPRKERSNVVKGTFLSEANSWQRFDFPSITDADAVEADGQEVITDLSLEMVGSVAQAQRLASMELRQARRGRTVQLVCSMKAMPARVGSNVVLNIPRYFDDEVFRVVELKFSVGNDGAPNLQITLLENNADIYEWDISKERQVNVPAELNAKSPQTAQPSFSPHANTSPSLPTAITITSLTPGAVIRWSKTAAPASSSDGTAYTAPVSVSSGDFLYARAFRSGYLASPATVEAYV